MRLDASSPRPQPDDRLDARHLLCPLPVLKARKRLLAMPPGAILEVSATDPAAVIDMPHFCAEAGHEFIGSFDGNSPGETLYYLRRSQS